VTKAIVHIDGELPEILETASLAEVRQLALL
jgi:hypothetical protein